jgi:hypothetical protein
VTSFDEEVEMYAARGQDLPTLLIGEIRRILEYPDRGFCLRADIPPEVLAACRHLESRQAAR